MSAHRLDIIIEEWGQLSSSLVCLNPASCPPVWELWPDEECHCTDPDCGCRQNDHEADHNYIKDLGPECRCVKVEGSCFYREMLDEVGLEDGFRFTDVKFSVAVNITGGSWDAPAEIGELLLERDRADG